MEAVGADVLSELPEEEDVAIGTACVDVFPEFPALDDDEDGAELLFPPAVLVDVAGADGVDALDDVDVDGDAPASLVPLLLALASEPLAESWAADPAALSAMDLTAPPTTPLAEPVAAVPAAAPVLPAIAPATAPVPADFALFAVDEDVLLSLGAFP